MARMSWTSSACFITAALSLLTGCLTRGPIPSAAPIGDGDDAACSDGNGCRCRHGIHLFDFLHSGGSAQPTEPPPLVAPISNFLPVPTRPVFTPWVVEPSPPEEISGPLAWKRSAIEHAAESPLEPVGEPSGLPVAQRTLPPPTILPEDRPLPNRSNSGYYDSPDDRPAANSRY
jgi:hypothetical protein